MVKITDQTYKPSPVEQLLSKHHCTIHSTKDGISTVIYYNTKEKGFSVYIQVKHNQKTIFKITVQKNNLDTVVDLAQKLEREQDSEIEVVVVNRLILDNIIVPRQPWTDFPQPWKKENPDRYPIKKTWPIPPDKTEYWLYVTL